MVLVSAEGEFLGDLAPAIRVVDLKARRMLWAIPRFAKYLRRHRPAVVISALNHVNVGRNPGPSTLGDVGARDPYHSRHALDGGPMRTGVPPIRALSFRPMVLFFALAALSVSRMASPTIWPLSREPVGNGCR